jgi:hypothetical protein
VRNTILNLGQKGATTFMMNVANSAKQYMLDLSLPLALLLLFSSLHWVHFIAH